MKLSTFIFPLLATVSSLGQGTPAIQLTGTAINTTDPEKPVAAKIQFLVHDKLCKLVVSLPLVGSGDCSIKTVDEKSGKIEISSAGPPSTVWIGLLKGNLLSGTYEVGSGVQAGTFYLVVAQEDPALPPVALIPKPAAPTSPRSSSRNGCSPAIESTISGETEGWSGETIFKLDNGQIWQQAEYDYNYFYAYRPDVLIYQTSEGCRMKVEDESETVLVKRLK